MPRASPNAPPDHTWCLLANNYLNIHTPAHTPSHILVLSYPYKTRTTNEYLPPPHKQVQRLHALHLPQPPGPQIRPR